MQDYNKNRWLYKYLETLWCVVLGQRWNKSCLEISWTRHLQTNFVRKTKFLFKSRNFHSNAILEELNMTNSGKSKQCLDGYCSQNFFTQYYLILNKLNKIIQRRRCVPCKVGNMQTHPSSTFPWRSSSSIKTPHMGHNLSFIWSNYMVSYVLYAQPVDRNQNIIMKTTWRGQSLCFA